VTERRLVDHRRPAAAQGRCTAPIQFSKRHSRILPESHGQQLIDQLFGRQKTLWLPGKFREDELFARNRANVLAERVPRKREHEPPRSGSGDACRLTDRGPELRARACEVPDAVGDDQVDALGLDRQAFHGREDGVDTRGRCLLPRAVRRGQQHRPGQVDCGHRPSLTRQRHGVAAGAGANVEEPAPSAPPFVCRKLHQRRVRLRLREAGDRAGTTPG